MAAIHSIELFDDIASFIRIGSMETNYMSAIQFDRRRFVSVGMLLSPFIHHPQQVMVSKAMPTISNELCSTIFPLNYFWIIKNTLDVYIYFRSLRFSFGTCTRSGHPNIRLGRRPDQISSGLLSSSRNGILLIK